MAGGEIQALPPALSGAGAALRGVAGDLDGVRGQFQGGSVAAGGCDPTAAGAFEDMQRAWQAEMSRLGSVVAGVSSALSIAAEDYTATDSSALPPPPGAGATAPGAGNPLAPLLLGPLQQTGPGSGG